MYNVNVSTCRQRHVEIFRNAARAAVVIRQVDSCYIRNGIVNLLATVTVALH